MQRKSKWSLKRWFKPVKITERFSAEADIIAAEISYTAEELIKMPKWRKKRIVENGRKLLYKNGACYVALADENAKSSIKIPVSKEYIKACIDYITKGREIIGEAVYVIDEEFKSVDYSLLESVCCKVKFLNIITGNSNAADRMCGRLCDEYGVYPEVCRNKDKIPGGAALVIDYDKGYVRLGRDLIVDGVELGMDLHGYNADLYEIVKNIPEIKENLSFKSWMSGKNQLTRMNC